VNTRNSTSVMHNVSVSVLIPCFNEEGNVAECIRRTPVMGRRTEIIVIDDGSRDATAATVHALLKQNPHVKIVSYWPNKGKAIAIAEGLKQATGDIVMILDADMTVRPESLNSFYDAFIGADAGLLIGTRFAFPFSRKAMRRMNVVSNKFAAALFSCILKTRITDTLCGTKVLWRKDACAIDWGRCRWGDFDILRYAALHQLKVAELPVPYHERMSGRSSMRIIPDGIMLYKRGLEIFFEVVWHDIFSRVRTGA